MPSRGQGDPRRGISVGSRRGCGPAGREKAPAAMPSRGHGDPRRGISVSSRRGWGPAASEKKMALKKLVVVGNGMAGARVVEEILKRAPERFDIVMFGAEPY